MPETKKCTNCGRAIRSEEGYLTLADNTTACMDCVRKSIEDTEDDPRYANNPVRKALKAGFRIPEKKPKP